MREENGIHTPTFWIAFRNNCTTLFPWTPLALKFFDHVSKTPCVNTNKMCPWGDQLIWMSLLLFHWCTDKKITFNQHLSDLSTLTELKKAELTRFYINLLEFNYTSSILDCAHGKEKVKPRGFLVWLMWCFCRKDFKDSATCSKSYKRMNTFSVRIISRLFI